MERFTSSYVMNWMAPWETSSSEGPSPLYSPASPSSRAMLVSASAPPPPSVCESGEWASGWVGCHDLRRHRRRSASFVKVPVGRPTVGHQIDCVGQGALQASTFTLVDQSPDLGVVPRRLWKADTIGSYVGNLSTGKPVSAVMA
eukprot:1192892-Prorocentrum_minimum.AAC.1